MIRIGSLWRNNSNVNFHVAYRIRARTRARVRVRRTFPHEQSRSAIFDPDDFLQEELYLQRKLQK